MTQNSRRSYERLFYCLISLVLVANVARAQSPSLTTITDTIYRADGTPAAGQLVITWPAFSTAANNAVAAGQKTLTLGAGGALSTQLAPNEGATPAGSYYKVVYKLSDGTTATEYWTVPAASPTTVSAIRATVVPSQVAAQLVTRQYVDSLVGPTDAVHKSGTETITGAKTFATSPTVPTPSVGTQAANKAYVDAQAGGGAGTDVMHLSGAETATGAKTFSGGLIASAGGSFAGTFDGSPTFSGSPTFKTFHGVLNATQFPGATLEAQVEAAYAALPASGGEIYIPADTYNANVACIDLNTANKPVVLRGAGQKATTINFTHTGDGICNLLPINASTQSKVVIRDLTLHNSNAANTGAAIDQVGGTNFRVENVEVTGHWRYGVVLDQTELGDVDYLNCNLLSASVAQRCVWIVNGAEHSPGATAGFTNRISVTRSQLNVGPNSVAIQDDGGYAHTFANNNYNGGLYGVWVTNVNGGVIFGGEFEGMSSNGIKFSHLSFDGNSKSAPYAFEVINTFINSGSAPIDIASAGTLQFLGNIFSRNGSVITGGNNANTIFSAGNYNSFNTAFYPSKATRHTSLSDYPEGGSIADSIGNSVEFGKTITIAGSSANPATNKFQITGASTGGVRTVTLADGNSVSVIPDGGAANHFLTGINSAGVITKAQPTFATLSGNISVSQLNSGTGASSSTFWRGDGTWAAPPGGGSAGLPDPSTEEWVHEDWCGGAAISGQVGRLGWRFQVFGGGSTGVDAYGATAGVGGGCAIQFRQAALTNGAGINFFLSPDGSGAPSLFNASGWWMQSSINLESTTSETVRFGKSSSVTAETGTDGAFIRYIGGTDATFICEAIRGGVTTTAAIAVTPVASTWYKTRVQRDAASGDITCTVNTTSATVTGANAPTGAAVFDVFQVKSLTASIFRLRSRYFEQHWTGLSR